MSRTWPFFAVLAGAGLILAPQFTQSRLGPLRADADCGPLALKYICEADGKPVSLDDLKRRIPTDASGTSLLELKQAAQSLGYKPEGMRLTFAALKERLSADPPTYAILHVGGDHFIAVVGLTNKGFLQVRGLPGGAQAVGEDELQQLDWDGIALVMRPSAVAAPALVFQPGTIELGRVPKGTQKAFKIKVTNTGSQDLRIARIEAGCGCIQVGVANPTIPAHGSDSLSGAFRAGEPGAVRRQIQVYTLSPVKEVFTVEMVGEVITTIGVEPKNVELRPDWYNSKGATASIRVTNNSDRDISLTTRPLSELVTVVPKHAEVERFKSVDLTVVVPDEIITSQRLEIALDTNHPYEATLVVPVQVIPEREIKVLPAAIHLGVATKEELLHRGPISMALGGPGAGVIAIDKIETPEFLEVAHCDPASSDGYRLELRLVDRFSGFAPSGHVVLYVHATDRESVRVKVRVPVSGLIRKGS